jgi:hypothetical protein
VSHGHKFSGRSFGVGHNFNGIHAGGLGGCGLGFGFGGYNDICGYAELYRELYNNLPYFALHPPVYYSQPVPRTYGYSPFAYPPYVMTPEIAVEAQPVTIINPHVQGPEKKVDKPKQDRTAARATPAEPLVIVNPFVAPNRTLAQSER